MPRTPLLAWMTVAALAAGTAQGETFHNKDNIFFEGTIRLALSNAAICNVLENHHSEKVYEERKANQGRPLHLWRVDLSVHNRSGRALDFLRADSWVRSDSPPCTNWDGPEALPDSSIWMTWSGRHEVLNMPYGMRPSQKESRALYILAFHDQQPKFERWSVDYRFVDDADREAEPARGAPVFIVVAVPAHATVSLLNVAQPYRQRMRLEPGRYQVEVSAPGYRTHRAWVDHKQTWPHRIELERLPGGDSSSTFSVPGATPGGQLPPEIQVDLNLHKAEQALRYGDAATARETMERLVLLQREHGLEPEAEDHFRYAQAWEAAGEPGRAMESTIRYLQLRGREAEHYKEALELMNRAESAQEGLASKVSEASRFVPQVALREGSQPTDRLEPAIAGAEQGEPVSISPPERLPRDQLTGFVVHPDTDMPIWIEATPSARRGITDLYWTKGGGYPIVFGYGPEGHAACEAIASGEGVKSECFSQSGLNGYLDLTWPCKGYAISRRPDGSYEVNTFYGVADEKSPDDVRRSREGRRALDGGHKLAIICLNP